MLGKKIIANRAAFGQDEVRSYEYNKKDLGKEVRKRYREMSEMSSTIY